MNAFARSSLNRAEEFIRADERDLGGGSSVKLIGTDMMEHMEWVKRGWCESKC